MIKLTKRLQQILNLVENVDTLADIGCDHGKLIVSAIVNKKAKNGIAVDISYDSLHKAKLLAKQYDVDDNIDFFVGNGTNPIENKVNCIVIAGMGGIEISKILAQGDKSDKYILVPHQDAYILRKYLRDNDYAVEKDFVVEDKKFYSLIVATKGSNDYKDAEIYIGKNYPKSNDFDLRNKKRYQDINKIIKQQKDNNSIKELDSNLLDEWEVLKNYYDTKS
ncbi:MAG: class I SAM-dependent methyltransferase [Clostridia bacterium]